VGNLFWVNYYAQIRNLDPALVCALILEESRFQQQALSVAGARGLMQILPPTGLKIARQLGLPSFEEKLLFEPEFNLRLGTWYLAQLLQEFSGKLPLALAAYNAGPHVVKEWVSRLKNFREDEFIENIPYSETRNYVIRVLNSFQAYRFLYRTAK
jgi:soluble lytic murein transglycosylase